MYLRRTGSQSQFSAALSLQASDREEIEETCARALDNLRFGIRSIPTLILFKSGREVARQAGAMGKGDIIHWVRAHI